MMRMTRSAVVLAAAAALATAAGCQKDKTDEPKTPTAVNTPVAAAHGAPGPVARRKVDPVKPPFDVTNPPADAVKTADGLVFKSIKEGTGPAPLKNDTVVVHYNAWHADGETMYSTQRRGRAVPMPLYNTAPGFVEALTMMKKGGRAMFWVPPAIGYRGKSPDQAETLAFEVEIVDVTPAPAIPPDVAAPPATAQKTAKGVSYVVLAPGPSKDKIRFYDSVVIQYTAWDPTGRMFDSTSQRHQPKPTAPFRETPGLEDALTQLVKGDKARFWIPGDLMKGSSTAPPGPVVYEVEVVDVKPQHAPPPVPADVAAPPADAQKTPLGVSYKVLKPGKGGDKPTTADRVSVHYTGWTTDGRMFDSSVVRDQPLPTPVGTGIIKGWTDGLQLMTVGEQARFWIPVELAYKGQPGKPAGMLVFDIELLSIEKAPDAGGGGEPMPPGHP